MRSSQLIFFAASPIAWQAASVVSRARAAGELRTTSGRSFRCLIKAPIFLLPRRPRSTSGRSKSSSPVLQSDFPCRNTSNVLPFILKLLLRAAIGKEMGRRANPEQRHAVAPVAQP
jgi:hypothetical protein